MARLHDDAQWRQARGFCGALRAFRRARGMRGAEEPWPKISIYGDGIRAWAPIEDAPLQSEASKLWRRGLQATAVAGAPSLFDTLRGLRTRFSRIRPYASQRLGFVFRNLLFYLFVEDPSVFAGVLVPAQRSSVPPPRPARLADGPELQIARRVILGSCGRCRYLQLEIIS
ncbi:hypothetical protein HYPSUDRAFT_365969 [Hypholoma sublateritium FD-334 SS-4]|uniref:Uncharacterized protein n=1 Tax=Hypholoma sublateritium (strain FD-334 SS-4) TaxID=945553 RepID=A0A0D2KLJ5_HYPSF|nr:hypothetical protein HYPSUDRAFT_365969 [Hypholoma sublateritium FD-334 SS-4]